MIEKVKVSKIDVPESLRCWIASAWRVDASEGHHITLLPDGRIDIVQVKADGFDGVFVSGPLQRHVLHKLQGSVRLNGVSLQPGAGVLLGVEVASLPLQWTNIAEFDLSEAKLVAVGGITGLFRFIEARAERSRLDTRLVDVFEKLHSGGGHETIMAMARRLRINERTLRRLFLRQVGMSPKAYSRIVRFQHTLQRLRQQPNQELARIAADLGFSDQSHMTRELVTLGGFSATRMERDGPKFETT